MNELITSDIKIENLIYEIRGKQVMLDSDLARLYNIMTGNLNKAVKRNIERFPENFMFQLTKEEYNSLIFQNGISNKRGGVRKIPYVFTEQGVAMLSSILHTPTAIQTSIKIINSFVAMRHYIGNNEYRLSNVEAKVIEHDKNIKLLQETFDALSEKRKVNEIYFNGQLFDARSKILEIFKSAKKELIIIDSYADNVLLDIIKRLNIKVILITKESNRLTMQDIEAYNKQYNNLKVIYNCAFHDRYFILDKKIIYHCGTSINSIGNKTFSINLISDSDIRNTLMDKISNLINE